MLITNATLITWEDENRVLENHSVYIQDDQIVEIGAEADLLARYPDAERLDAGGQYVMPGNICGHTHFYGAYARGMAIHGSAPRMVKEGRAQYADPCSMIRAGAMMLNHIGFADRGRQLEMALDICGNYEQKLKMTGRSDGATGEEYGKYLMETMQDPNLESRWQGYQSD